MCYTDELRAIEREAREQGERDSLIEAHDDALDTIAELRERTDRLEMLLRGVRDLLAIIDADGLHPHQSTAIGAGLLAIDAALRDAAEQRGTM